MCFSKLQEREYVISLLNAVLLDLGDTLVHMSRPWDDVFNDNIESLHDYLKKLGFRLDYQQFAETFIRIFEDAASRADLYKVEIPMADIIAKTLRKSRLEVLGVDLIRNAEIEFFAPEVKAWQLYPDTVETLTNLRDEGFKMGLISNAKSDWAVRAILEKNDITKYFGSVVTSASLRIRKPRPEIFTRTLSDLAVKPSDTVFVGDSLEADISGARRVGMRSIHLLRKPVEAAHQAEPEATVTSLTEAAGQIIAWKNGSLE
ncbi:MAG: HAD-IIIA family hydrolase [Candidatus Bathyarchaeia archaeon]